MADEDDPPDEDAPPEPAPAPGPELYASCDTRVTAAQVIGCCTNLDAEVEQDVIAATSAIDEVLYLFDLLTEFRFRGVCAATIQPTGAPGCSPCGMAPEALGQLWPEWLPPMVPMVKSPVGALGGPTLVNCWWSGTASRVPAIRLPWLPVHDVLEVRIGADVLDPTKWRLLPGTNLLVRTDGEPFPESQNLLVAPGAEGTWTVTFRHGYPLPPGVDRRIAGFACLIARSCRGDDCQLPDGVRITRKGDEEYAIVVDYRADGLTGYVPLDDWINTWRKTRGDSRVQPRMSRPGRGRLRSGARTS